MSRMEEFRSFVNNYPKIREDVVNNKRTWQSIYEDFVILGPDSNVWDQYKERKKSILRFKRNIRKNLQWWNA